MAFGEKLQALRKSKGLSQEQLAAQMTVSRQAISKWELGESNPDIENLIQISNIFNVTIDYLLKDDESSNRMDQYTAQNNQNTVTAQILLVASVAFLAIGLLCAFSGWNQETPGEAIWGGMLIQVVGVTAYCIGRILSKSKAPFGVDFANLAIGLFMPVSMVVSLLCNHVIAPYPMAFPDIPFFLVGYIGILISLYVVMKKRWK